METEVKIREVGNGWIVVVDGTEYVADAGNPQKIGEIILEKIQEKNVQEEKTQEKEAQEENVQNEEVQEEEVQTQDKDG